MIVHLVLGALLGAGSVALVNYVQKNEISVSWWQWILTTLGILYTLFVAEVIAGFLFEGAPQAALVMGLVTGIVAVIGGVLLKRFVFNKKAA